MKLEFSTWAFLRPLLIAVAVAASWVALSAAGASADSSTSSDPLLGGAQSTVGSVTATITRQAMDVLEQVEAGPASAPASTIPTRVAVPPLQPAVADAAALADAAAQAVPVVKTVVPAGAVAAVADPAAGTVDGVMGGTVAALVPVAGAVLEPFDPVLEPAVAAAPLPVPLSDAPVTTTAAAPPPAADVPQAGGGAPTPAAEPETETAGAAPASAGPLHDALHGTGLACAPRMKAAAGTPLPPGTDVPLRGPSHSPPGVPGAATGGSSPSGGNGSVKPAWLGAHNLPVPAAGTATVRAGRPAAPAPVSFDPGSSPD